MTVGDMGHQEAAVSAYHVCWSSGLLMLSYIQLCLYMVSTFLAWYLLLRGTCTAGVVLVTAGMLHAQQLA
jgi:hypothetical protein